MRPASAPSRATRSSGATPLPSDFDIAWPPRVTMPCVKSRVNGSVASTSPASCRTFWKKREYSRCRIACSMPPVYWSTGIQRLASSESNASTRSCALV